MKKDNSWKKLQKAMNLGYRIELRCNGDLIFGFSTGKRPKNHKQMVKLLREAIEIMDSPEVSDPEVLGKYSPRAL